MTDVRRFKNAHFQQNLIYNYMNYRDCKIRVRDLNDLFPILMGWSPSGWGEKDLEKKRD